METEVVSEKKEAAVVVGQRERRSLSMVQVKVRTRLDS